MKRVCVYAASRSGARPEFLVAAQDLGTALVASGLDLVYGGSRNGLMGAVADAVLAGGGRVTGVMPSGLFAKEVVHEGLTEFLEVRDMHERKATMNRLADAFIALPGGVGTLEEVLEAVCWSQLGIHKKPVGLLSTQGYYAPLLQMLDHALLSGFVTAEHRALWLADEDPHTLLALLRRDTEDGKPSQPKLFRVPTVL